MTSLRRPRHPLAMRAAVETGTVNWPRRTTMPWLTHACDSLYSVRIWIRSPSQRVEVKAIFGADEFDMKTFEAKMLILWFPVGKWSSFSVSS